MMHSLSAPPGATSASEWLSQTASRLASAPVAHADLLATVAMLTAALERQARLEPPGAAAMGRLREPLARLPEQLVYLDPRHPAFGWLQLSAFVEFHGEPLLARLVVDALADRLGEHDGYQAQACGIPDDERAELIALCWTRRGRIARIAGQLDDAQHAFDEALARTSAAWRDARLAAELGLANLAIARGNYPLVETRCTALLSTPHASSALAPVHQVALYQMRAIAYRKRGHLLDALLDSWRAYDLLGHASAHRAELLVSMAETALDARDVTAALAAFATAEVEAEASGAPLRIVVAAVAGHARASLAHNLTLPAENVSAEPVQVAASRLSALLTRALAPRERVHALVTLAECQVRLGDFRAATDALDIAERLSAQHAFNDHQFRIHALRNDVIAVRQQTHAPAPRATSWPSPSGVNATWPPRHPARVRLAELARHS